MKTFPLRFFRYQWSLAQMSIVNFAIIKNLSENEKEKNELGEKCMMREISITELNKNSRVY